MSKNISKIAIGLFASTAITVGLAATAGQSFANEESHYFRWHVSGVKATDAPYGGGEDVGGGGSGDGGSESGDPEDEGGEGSGGDGSGDPEDEGGESDPGGSEGGGSDPEDDPDPGIEGQLEEQEKNSAACVDAAVNLPGFVRDGVNAKRIVTAGEGNVNFGDIPDVVALCNNILVKAWGAGGGASQNLSSANGGGGGYAAAYFPISTDSFYYRIGTGGGSGDNIGSGHSSSGDFSGGISKVWDNYNYGDYSDGGAGGGATIIEDATGARELYVVAAGGGGASLNPGYGGGDGVGSTIGIEGHNPNKGGNVVAGTAPGYDVGSGIVGGGGGGGGGYGGGGGGAPNEGGDGGANYVYSGVLSAYTEAAPSHQAAGSSDPDYNPGVGTGGTSPGSQGTGGRIVFILLSE